MGPLDDRIISLRARIKLMRVDLATLEDELARGEAKLDAVQSANDNKPAKELGLRLIQEEYKRYGRQMIIPEIGIQGQLKLKEASVLIVGAGGLGCPAAAYLAAAGVGTLGLVDGDTVELSNLHRQILHSSSRIGMNKVDSAIEYLSRLNLNVRYRTHAYHLSSQNAVATISPYDLVLDCTDHPTSRYLVSDAAVLAGRPIVSASALKMEGQLMVLNNPPSLRGRDSSMSEGRTSKNVDMDWQASNILERPKGSEPKVENEKAEGGALSGITNGTPDEVGFCYRCVFPQPPPADSVTSCADGGILGPVVGVMGVLMATEAIKLLVASPETIKMSKYSMLLYNAWSDPPLRRVRLRGKRQNCVVCSASASITHKSLESGSLDYALFCGVLPKKDIIKERISAMEYSRLRNQPHILVDVREKVQFDICNIQDSINLPFSGITRDVSKSISHLPNDGTPIYFICRFGNDSQFAVQRFREIRDPKTQARYAFKGDVKGGLTAWREEVDGDFPDY